MRTRTFTLLVTANVYPDLGGVGGRSTLISIVGALLTITLIVAVLMMIISAIVWAVCFLDRERPIRCQRQGRGVRRSRGSGPGRSRGGVDELPPEPRRHFLTAQFAASEASHLSW